MITLKQALKIGQTQLDGCSTSAMEDCEMLLGHLLNKNSAWLIAHTEDTLNSEQAITFKNHLKRRSAGEPVAYILGKRDFWKHQFEVNPNVLIPRPESELLVELTIQIAKKHLRSDQPHTVADMGTGSGAIAISIATELPQSEITAVDLSIKALAVARKNALKIGASNIKFISSDWFSELGSQRFNTIVSNPPYVAANDHHLDQGDLRYEPLSALQAGPEGMDDLSEIIKRAAKHLKPNGSLFVEHGFDQGSAVRKLFATAGYSNIVTHRDLAGLERISCGISG